MLVKLPFWELESHVTSLRGNTRGTWWPSVVNGSGPHNKKLFGDSVCASSTPFREPHSCNISIEMKTSVKTDYDLQGFVVVQGLIPDEDRTALQKACERAIARTRSGEWTHRRTVGKQFPPYGSDHPDSWGVQHVMHPDLKEPAFAKWYTSDALINICKELLGCQEEHLQMGG